MPAGIDFSSPRILSRGEPGRPKVLARLLRELQSLVSRAQPAPSIDDLNDRALADLNLHRWQLNYPDPRAPQLF
jgi:uncharacterized protein YjiS (DUF1127 family)